MPGEGVILLTKEITKRFGGLVAVNNLSLEVNEGEILAVIGPNGAGKTTLLNLISGLYPPDFGKIIFMGKDITKMGPDKRCKLGISRTFQLLSPIPPFNVIENIMVGSLFGSSKKRSIEEAKKLAMDVLEFVGLAQKSNSPIQELSTIELKKLEVARALATQPKLILLDEVMAGLTSEEFSEFIDLIKSINKLGITIILIEHVMHVVEKLSDRVVCMDQGTKIAEGDYETVAKNPQVIKAYLGEEYGLT